MMNFLILMSQTLTR